MKFRWSWIIPFGWDEVEVSETESYGFDSGKWKIFFSSYQFFLTRANLSYYTSCMQTGKLSLRCFNWVIQFQVFREYLITFSLLSAAVVFFFSNSKILLTFHSNFRCTVLPKDVRGKFVKKKKCWSIRFKKLKKKKKFLRQIYRA